MDAKEAIKLVREQFPFAGYIADDRQYVTTANTVLRILRPGSRILDFGSGPCDVTAVLQKVGFQCSAVDDLCDYWHTLGENRSLIQQFAREQGIEFICQCGADLPLEKESFDMCMLKGVVEHLHDSPRELLNDLLEYVRPEGLLYIAVPNAVNIRKRIEVMRGRTNLARFDAFYWNPGPWRGHVREYTRGDLQSLAEFLRLDIVELKSCHCALGRVPRHLQKIYCLVTIPFHGWRDTWYLAARKPRNWKPNRTPDTAHMARLSTLGAGGYQYAEC